MSQGYNAHGGNRRPAPRGARQEQPAEAFTFAPAVKSEKKLRMAIDGPPGTGKSYTALEIATGIATSTGTKIAVIDTEHGSASMYADQFDFSVLKLSAPYTPQRYVGAIRAARDAGFGVLIVDSLSHSWAGEGGSQDQHTEEVVNQRARGSKENSFTAWRPVKPAHNHLVGAILSYPGHVICTLRSKTDYVINGGRVTKVGVKAIHQPDVEYEFDIVAQMTTETGTPTARIVKSRLFDLNGVVIERPSRAVGVKMIELLGAGRTTQEPEPEPNPATSAPSATADDVRRAMNNASSEGIVSGVNALANLPDAVWDIKQCREFGPDRIASLGLHIDAVYSALMA